MSASARLPSSIGSITASPRTEPIALEGAGTRDANGEHLFNLSGKAKEGDEVRYRIRIADNRNVPEAKLGPNVVYFPPDRWRTLKITRASDPKDMQDILAQRDDVNRRLDAIKNQIVNERNALQKLHKDSVAQDTLKPEQAQDLKSIRKENRSATNSLEELARDVAQTPALKPVADRAQDVAEQEMRRSEKSLQEAAKKPENADRRNREFQKSDRELAEAIKRLDDLKRENDRVAQARLDQMKLEKMAERQKQLAELAAELAKKDPSKDPDARAQAEQLKREQNELAAELDKLANQSEPLRNALDQAKAEETQKLADKARELAQAQRELADAQKQDRQARFADLAKKQQALADQAKKLAEDTHKASQTAKANPLKPDDTQKAAEELKEGNPEQALNRQDLSAKELDRVAKDLERAIELAKDPREAARQLAGFRRIIANGSATRTTRLRPPSAWPR